MVTQYRFHKKYRMWLSSLRKYHAHDEDEYAQVGDKVVIRNLEVKKSKIKPYFIRNVVLPMGLANDGNFRKDELDAMDYNSKLRNEYAQSLTEEPLDKHVF